MQVLRLKKLKTFGGNPRGGGAYDRDRARVAWRRPFALLRVTAWGTCRGYMCTLHVHAVMHTVMLRPVTRPKHLIGRCRSIVPEMLRSAQHDRVGHVRVLHVQAACARCVCTLHARALSTLSMHAVMLRPVTRPKHLIGGAQEQRGGGASLRSA